MTKRTKSKPGPKPIAIDPKVVEGMAGVGAQTKEIAEFLGVSTDTIERRCQRELDRARAGMKVKLRKRQWDIAMGVDRMATTMCIWLGKQVLGQTDKQALEHTGAEGGPLSVSVTYHVVDPVAR